MLLCRAVGLTHSQGILEPGEECDGGSTGSACCDPETCRFTQGSVCDPSNSACCTPSCQLRPAGTICRPSVDSRCDIAEACTGSSADCPADTYQDDGTSCGAGELACASGICTSRDLQCQNQATSLNITQACPLNTDSSCSVTCQDPRTGRGACVVLDSQFVDGTPCGYAGTWCVRSSCSLLSAELTIRTARMALAITDLSWTQRNRGIRGI